MDDYLKRAISLIEELREIIDLFIKYGYTPDNSACTEIQKTFYEYFVFLYNGVNVCIEELLNDKK